MAFGNATIGDLKKIAGGGGGGGGTDDYTKLTNKPSINGVELLGDSNIGKLSGNIKVTLSALDNVSLTSPTNAQTLLFDSLTNKWKNGTVGGVSITPIDVTDNQCQFNIDDVKLIILVGSYFNTYTNKTNKYTAIYTPNEIASGNILVVVGDGTRYVTAEPTINQNQITLSREYDGGLAFSKVYLIK